MAAIDPSNTSLVPGSTPVAPVVAAPAPTIPPAGMVQPAQPTPTPQPMGNISDTETVTGTTVSDVKSKRKFPKKLIFILLLIIILGISAFFAYKQFFSGNGTGIGNIGSPREVSLTWWGLWEDSTIITPLINEYQALHPEVTITYKPQSKENYRERLTNSLARGEGPDIFRIHNTWTPMFANDLATLPSSVMSQQEYSETFYQVASSDFSLGAGIVAIPLMYDGLGLYINEDIFETFGETAPTTWDELRVLASRLTIKSEGKITQAGVALGRTENVDHWPEILALMMRQNGVDLKKPTGESAEGALQYFTIFSSTDGVWDETLPSSTQAFAAGKVAMYFGPSWRAFEIETQNPTLRYRVVIVPQLAKDSPDDPDVGYASYWAEGVWERSRGKTQAWEFLKFLSTKESLQKLYANASKVRAFGEPYPRADMKQLLTSDPKVGAFVNQASYSKSWYLASRTYDGPTGINSQLSGYFEDAINSLNTRGGGNATSALDTVSAGVTQVLSQYGLVQAPAPSPN